MHYKGKRSTTSREREGWGDPTPRRVKNGASDNASHLYSFSKGGREGGGKRRWYTAGKGKTKMDVLYIIPGLDENYGTVDHDSIIKQLHLARERFESVCAGGPGHRAGTIGTAGNATRSREKMPRRREGHHQSVKTHSSPWKRRGPGCPPFNRRGSTASGPESDFACSGSKEPSYAPSPPNLPPPRTAPGGPFAPPGWQTATDDGPC